MPLKIIDPRYIRLQPKTKTIKYVCNEWIQMQHNQRLPISSHLQRDDTDAHI